MSEHDHENPDLRHADELLERTRTFLTRCLEDPEHAFEDEDPDELRHNLYALTHPPEAPPPKLERLPEEDLLGDDEVDEDPPAEHRRSA